MRSHRHAFWALTLCLAACGDEHPVSLTPEPPPPPSSGATEPPPSAPPPATEASGEVDAGLAPTSLAQSTTPADVRRIRVPYLSGANRTLHARIDALVESARSQFAIEVRQAAAHHTATAELPDCRPWVITPALVATQCATRWEDDGREDVAVGLVRVYYFEIDGDEVRPTTLESAFVDQAALDAVIADGLATACDTARQLGMSDAAFDACPRGWSAGYVALTAGTVYISWRVGREETWGTSVEYADVLDRLRADGPVARMLRVGAFAPTDAVPAPPAAPGDIEGPWALTGSVPDAEAATRWAALEPALRDDVVAYTSAPGLVQLGVEVSRGIVRARELATALQGTLAAAPAGAALRVFDLRHASRSLNVRAQAESSATWVRTLPRGTIVIAMTDPAVPVTPWVTVIAGTSEGWASSRYLEPEGCYPDVSRAAAGIPAGSRDLARRQWLRVRAGVPDGNRLGSAMLVVWERDASLWRLDEEACSLGARVGAWTTDDQIVDALVTRTAEHDGVPLVLLQTVPDHGAHDDSPRFDAHTGTSWHAYRVGPEPRDSAWELGGFAHPSISNDVVGPATRGPSGHGFWPLAIVRRGQPIVPYRWTGDTLEADAPSPPAEASAEPTH